MPLAVKDAAIASTNSGLAGSSDAKNFQSLLVMKRGACGWLTIAINRFAAMPFLIAVKEAKFRSPVLPGEELEFDGKIIHEGSGFNVGEAKGNRKGRTICEAQLTFRLAPIPNPDFRQAMLGVAERIEMPGRELFAATANEPNKESGQ